MPDSILTLELLARGAAVGTFLGLAVIVARGGFSPARVTGSLFALAAAAHTLTQMPGVAIDRALGWAWPPVWGFSAMGAGLFWAFVGELFEDRPRLAPVRFAPAIALLAIGLGIAFTDARGFRLVHNLAGAGVLAHALIVIAAGWRGDLVETRRRLRGPLLALGAIYALAVLAVQTGELYLGSADELSPIAAVALMAFGLLSLGVFGRADPSLFGAAGRADLATDADAEGDALSALSGEDAATIAALERLMREDRVYRQEGLTIAALALKLRTPEHRLRRVINQGLGFRNFSAFLNRWRLGEAKHALADPTQREVPVSTIALDAGFQSLGPFNRAFKAETGQTPTEFRAQALTDSAAIAKTQSSTD